MPVVRAPEYVCIQSTAVIKAVELVHKHSLSVDEHPPMFAVDMQV